MFHSNVFLKTHLFMYDEEIDIVDGEEIPTPSVSSTMNENLTKTDGNFDDLVEFQEKGEENWQLADRGLIGQLSDNTDNSEDDDDDVRAPALQGGYDPNDYEELAVSADIKELFAHITKYVPQTIELETKLAPFLPDLIPAVGDIDGFLKVPRPDGAKDGLGLFVLDEPCSTQSDPIVLQLQLRAQAKQTEDKSLVVKKVQNADSNTKSVDKWINAISDLHSRKPPPTVHYSKPMPNVDNLMQEWPEKMEKQLEMVSVPGPTLDCDLTTYVTLLCNIFDIPVYDNKIQSLHQFFNLYSTMKSTRAQLVQDTLHINSEDNH